MRFIVLLYLMACGAGEPASEPAGEPELDFQEWEKAYDDGDQFLVESKYGEAHSAFLDAEKLAKESNEEALVALCEKGVIQSLVGLKQYDEAVAKALELIGTLDAVVIEEDAEGIKWRQSNLLEVNSILGRIMLQKSDISGAIKHFARACELSEGLDDDFVRLRVDSQVNLISALVDNGRFSDASDVSTALLENFKKVSTFPPEYSANIKLDVVLVRMENREADKATALLDQVSAMPNLTAELSTRAKLYKAGLLLQESNVDAALSVLQEIESATTPDTDYGITNVRKYFWLSQAHAVKDEKSPKVTEYLIKSHKLLDPRSAWFEPILMAEMAKYFSEEEMPPKFFRTPAEGSEEENASKEGTDAPPITEEKSE